MRNKWIRMLALALVLVMSFGLLVACDKKDSGSASDPDAPKKDVKVALILEGSIADMSWNATAYEGLKRIEGLGATIGHTENTPVASAADAIRAFASDGYDVIFMSSNSFQDVAVETAKEFPDVQFFLINSAATESNIRSFAIQDAEQGFLMGALAALLSVNNKVGFIGGLPINPIINGGKGFEQGAKYVNPDIEIMSQNTGNFDDAVAAKELAKQFVSEGVDVLCPMANQASLGVMEAAEETGVLAIGSGRNQETVAPNAAVVAIIKDTSIAYEAAYKSYLEGKMPEEILPMGAAQGVIYIGEYYKDDISQDIKDKLNDIQQKLAAGEIKIKLD
ncbi:MAG TPA: BMP family ABC transporter substrate-binding protein [Clostridiaceae bacterium]|jgi:basic membrane protein A|nr:BMP family ABC transporter substrate-binding protein [Clostridiaceae bacterium]